MPSEYCEWDPSFKKCQVWFAANYKDLYPDVAEDGLVELMTELGLEGETDDAAKKAQKAKKKPDAPEGAPAAEQQVSAKEKKKDASRQVVIELEKGKGKPWGHGCNAKTLEYTDDLLGDGVCDPLDPRWDLPFTLEDPTQHVDLFVNQTMSPLLPFINGSGEVNTWELVGEVPEGLTFGWSPARDAVLDGSIRGTPGNARGTSGGAGGADA